MRPSNILKLLRHAIVFCGPNNAREDYNRLDV